MIELGKSYQLQASYAQVQPCRSRHEHWATCAALRLHQRARSRSILGWIRGLVAGGSCFLLDLGRVQATCKIRERVDLGTRPVPIDRILGSEGRGKDFDAGFRPLRAHSQARWVRVAEAMYMGVTLPPVELIQVGDVYFVRDGHHRVSVAKALGQAEIEAHVTVWSVASVLPWEQAAPAPSAARRALSI
jgi:hypothetical protein